MKNLLVGILFIFSVSPIIAQPYINASLNSGGALDRAFSFRSQITGLKAVGGYNFGEKFKVGLGVSNGGISYDNGSTEFTNYFTQSFFFFKTSPFRAWLGLECGRSFLTKEYYVFYSTSEFDSESTWYMEPCIGQVINVRKIRGLEFYFKESLAYYFFKNRERFFIMEIGITYNFNGE